ncbi:Uncharacterised protein [Klebsiella pneumoniae]|nr:Uncharacterised protein [Klebsiella pneumoniae]
MQSLQRRRRRAENYRDLLAVGAPYRQVAGMVAPAFLLLVGAVMLFVDDDDAEIFKWGKQRGAGADHNGRFAIFRLQPGRETFAVIEPGVQHFHRRVKANVSRPG